MLTILLTAALSGLWDDESFLGKGPTAGIGAGVAITRHLNAEGEVTFASQNRDSGYLAVSGNPVTATARLSLTVLNRDAAVRPFVSAGATWLRSTEHFKFHSTMGGPTGFPVQGPVTPSSYRASTAGVELGAGVEIRTSSRLSIRPEARLSFTQSARKHDELESPLAIIRGGVTFAWRAK